MKYELRYHGFVEQFGYDVWEILEDGVSNGTLYPDKEAAQRRVNFYNDNGISAEEYGAMLRTKPRTALEMFHHKLLYKYEGLFKDSEDKQ